MRTLMNLALIICSLCWSPFCLAVYQCTQGCVFFFWSKGLIWLNISLISLLFFLSHSMALIKWTERGNWGRRDDYLVTGSGIYFSLGQNFTGVCLCRLTINHLWQECDWLLKSPKPCNRVTQPVFIFACRLHFVLQCLQCSQKHTSTFVTAYSQAITAVITGDRTLTH